MTISGKKLLLITLLYIYIPVAIFLLGFTAVWVWMATLTAVGYFGYKMYRDYVGGLGDDTMMSWPVFGTAIFIIVLVCIIIGFGGIFDQSGDWYKHNAVLHDLLNKNWPVYYTENEESMLTYYLGQYLVPALLGKLVAGFTGGTENSEIPFKVTEAAMALWGMFGVVLVYLNLCRMTVADTVKKQLRLVFILLFFCGALPVAQIMCNDIFGENMYSLGSHHWMLANGLMIQYRSNLVMLRWIYPQVIVIWLIIILFMENKRKYEHYVLLLVPILLFGTFSIVMMALLALGYAAFMLLVSDDKKSVLKSIFSLSNIINTLTLGVVLVSYFYGYLQVKKPDYMTFHFVGFGAKKLLTILIFDLFMFGVYSICVYRRQKKSVIFYMVNIMLTVIPFFTMGVFNDWVMGTSVPGLFIIMIYVVDMINASESLPDGTEESVVRRYKIIKTVLIITLLIGSWYPLMEVKENLVAYKPGDNTWDGYGTLEQYSDRSSSESQDLIYNYYTYDLDGKFFYEYLAANKVSETNGSGFNRGVSKKRSVSGIYFDTFISISAYDDTTQEVLEGALDICDKYSKILSKTDEESELYKINHRVIGEANNKVEESVYKITISNDLRNVLEAGLEYGKITDGRFNIAMGTVTGLWDFSSGNGTVPEEWLIDEALKHIDLDKVALEENELTIEDDSLQFDLGGIAKGYIANELRDYFLEKGSSQIVIALGGNIMCIGNKGGANYTVGIQKPYGGKGEAISSIQVSDTSVVSSGVYERYFEQDGIKYHHILNPVTGYSANTDVAGVSVICKDSMKADAISTTVLMMGKEYGLEFLDTVNEKSSGEPVAEVIFVDENGIISNWKCDEKE